MINLKELIDRERKTIKSLDIENNFCRGYLDAAIEYHLNVRTALTALNILIQRLGLTLEKDPFGTYVAIVLKQSKTGAIMLDRDFDFLSEFIPEAKK